MNKFMQNPIVQWVEYRLPIFEFIDHSVGTYPTPRNLNYWWNFGSLAGIVLTLQLVTGIVLAMHYTPHVDMAFASVERMDRFSGSRSTAARIRSVAAARWSTSSRKSITSLMRKALSG